MAVVAHFGTFDVENYGDLLFPAILEHRLGDLGHGFVHVSPHGGPPPWDDCVSTVAAELLIDDPPDIAGVIVGGGHIIHASPSSLDRYDQGGLSSIVAYPSLWLGAAYLAAQRNVPYCWNAPGVAQAFTPTTRHLVAWTASIADYLSVRDRASHSRIVDAGITGPIRVVPDTALEVARLWSPEQLEAAYSDAFVGRGREVPDRTFVVHLNRRYAGEDLDILAARLDRIAQRLHASPILIAMGPCHGDDQLQRDVGRRMTSAPLVIDRPRSLREITACIARGEAYLGSSLHGMITACSFGTRGMVIIPRAASMAGKFIGFLETFQLTRWQAESWEETEHRLEEFIIAPPDPWTRVLNAATLILDEHWARVSAVLAPPAKKQRSAPVAGDIQGAIDRLAAARGPVTWSAMLYAPILSEQAILASENLKAANEERSQKEEALAEAVRLRMEMATERAQYQESVEVLRAAGAQTRLALDDLRVERDQQQADITRERQQFHADLEAERRVREEVIRDGDRALEELRREREQLHAELANDRAQHQQTVDALRSELAERERLLSAADKTRQVLEQQAQADAERLQAELATERRDKERALTERERLLREVEQLQATRDQAQQALEELRREREQLHAELANDRAQHQQTVDALRSELAERERLLSAADKTRQVLEQQAQADAERLQAEFVGERERLQAVVVEREHQLQEAEKVRQVREEQAQADAERLRAEVLTEGRDKERALAERERLLREVEHLRAAVKGAILLAEENTENLLEAGRRLGQIDAVLDQLVARMSTKTGKRLVDSAHRTVSQIREELALITRINELVQSEDMSPDLLTYDPTRVLPGLPTPTPANVSSAMSVDASDRSDAAFIHHLTREVDGSTIPGGNGSEDSWHVDIIICVHDALEDVKRCLASVLRHTAVQHRVIVVDDASDAECAAFLRDFASINTQATLLRNEDPTGYTRSANQGLRESSGDFLVLLNSDTIVTSSWLERLVECARSDPKIGILGPLSNAASYQSVPERFDPNGDWALNPLPPGWDVDQLAAAVAKISFRAFPRVPFVNGFCFAVKRTVIDAIGYFDEEGFPDGFGEENDYCLRAADAGFALAIADHAYVYHAKSRSYSHERRRDLGKTGRGVLLRKFGVERVQAGEAILRDEPTLEQMRLALSAYVKAFKPAPSGLRVLFLLPVSGGGGGAHSVVQEAAGMRRLGVDAQVAIRSKHMELYRTNYPTIADAEQLFFGYRTIDELAARAAKFSVVVATIHTSMPLLAVIAAEQPSLVPAYYIQDYEPFFYPEGSSDWEEATRSYTLVPDALLVAKTHWLCNTVHKLHGVAVHKVSPSLDHDVYFPSPTKRQGSRVRVVAMIRPSSARRGAGRTMEVLRRLVQEFSERVDVHTFGCTESNLAAEQLPVDFAFVNRGILTREQVAQLLREADVFLDLSDYQAFGRTGLEAMACGCAVVVPALGGTDEYAIDRENALIVDTSQLEACYEAARELVADAELRGRLQRAGLERAAEYSIDRAARSELELFKEILATRHSLSKVNSRAVVVA